MKTLYFDCFAGASGDMILGALVSAGANPRKLVQELKLLEIPNWEIDFVRAERSGISALHALVKAGEEHHHRHLADILKIINGSKLSVDVKAIAGKIFLRLAQAEGVVHHLPAESVHFHEVGGLDAIIDIVGASIGFNLLGLEKFICSPLHVGSGMVEMAHGRFPVPPPAVTELLKGIPIYASDVVGELVTPTGAAIISSVCNEYGPLPSLKLGSIGYGAGSREYRRFPNVLRVLIGDQGGPRNPYLSEKLMILETNIDDMSPRSFGNLMQMALDRGALDCYFTPVQMKKNRPGVLVSMLCKPPAVDALCDLIFRETTTFGLRTYEVDRRFLERKAFAVETPYGRIDIKVGTLNGQRLQAMPEYDQCLRAARDAGVSLEVVETAARESFSRLKSGEDLASLKEGIKEKV